MDMVLYIMDMLQVEMHADAPEGVHTAHQIMYTQAPKGVNDPSTHRMVYTQAPHSGHQVVIIPGEFCFWAGIIHVQITLHEYSLVLLGNTLLPLIFIY